MSASVNSAQKDVTRTLRLSITGDCNLNCFYCKPLDRTRDLIEPKNPIQPSDVSRLVKIVADRGVTNVVLSGGEPLLRKDAPAFIKSAFAHKNIENVRLVTNGTHLKAYADPLKKMGLRKVDVNFDSLNFMKYQAITKRDDLFRVLDGVEKVEKLNYTDIRLNFYLLRGINHDEIIDIATMTKDRKLHIRFLEYVPLKPELDPNTEKLSLSILNVKRAINSFQRLQQDMDIEDESLAPTFRFEGGRGKMSFLSQVELEKERSVPRLLFTADGTLVNEAVPTSKGHSVVSELRRDAKDEKLHRLVERIMWSHVDKDKKLTSAPTSKSTKSSAARKSKTSARSTSNRRAASTASARR